YHVLHRLRAPRHPPCARSSLTIKFAHRKLDQHIRSLTPSSSEATHFGRIESIWEFCLFDYQRALQQNSIQQNLSSISISDEPFKYSLNRLYLSRSALGAGFVTPLLQTGGG